jgi:cytochrome P450
MRTITTRMVVRGIGVELPIITTLGKVLKFVPIPVIQDIFRPNDVLYDHATKYLDSIKASETSSNIFSNIAAEAELGETLSMQDVHLEAAGLIIAGTDTTSVTLTYLVWAVLSQPKLQAELEDEVAALRDDYGDADLEKLPLLNAVIEETLRLYGAAPSGLPRSVPPGGVTIDGQIIPAGTTVTTQAYTYHRDPKLFPRPLEQVFPTLSTSVNGPLTKHRFRPSRWLNNEISPAAKKAFHPLGAGARVCLGIHLAYMELRLASAEFFRECKGARLGAGTTEESMELENYFLVTPRGHKCEVVLV